MRAIKTFQNVSTFTPASFFGTKCNFCALERRRLSLKVQLRRELLLSGLCRWEQPADGDVSQRTSGFIKSNVSSHRSCRSVSGLACGWLFELLLHNLVTLKLCNYRTPGHSSMGGKSKMAAALILTERFFHVQWRGCKVTHTQNQLSRCPAATRQERDAG